MKKGHKIKVEESVYQQLQK